MQPLKTLSTVSCCFLKSEIHQKSAQGRKVKNYAGNNISSCYAFSQGPLEKRVCVWSIEKCRPVPDTRIRFSITRDKQFAGWMDGWQVKEIKNTCGLAASTPYFSWKDFGSDVQFILNGRESANFPRPIDNRSTGQNNPTHVTQSTNTSFDKPQTLEVNAHIFKTCLFPVRLHKTIFIPITSLC